MPLLDSRHRPLKDLRISVTDRCNFRCPYCMPADIFDGDERFLPRSKILRFEEIVRVARVAVSLGARKLRLTGGEPLLRQQLPQLVEQLAAIDDVEDLALTTNGVLLPRWAEALAQAGLDRVTVSLDTLDATTFDTMSGHQGATVDQVLAGIEAAVEAGLTPVKVNCVVQRGVNEADVVRLAARFRGTGIVPRFIEFMDVGTENGWRLDKVVPAAEILERLRTVGPLEPLAASRPDEVARRYRFLDGSGEVGIISSVTQPFCGDCSRGRLTPEGQFFTCLFGSTGIDLRSPLREGASDDTLRERLTQAWSRRTDRYSEVRGDATTDTARVQMYRIGG